MAGGADRDSGGKRVIQALIIVILIMIVAIEGVLIFFRLPAQRLSRELRLGEKYLDELQYEDAILSFTEAIRISPKSAEAYFNRGLAYEGLADEQANKAAQYPDAEAEKNYGKARRDFQKAAELGYESGDLDAHLTKVRKILTEYDDFRHPKATPTPTPTPTPAARAMSAGEYEPLSVIIGGMMTHLWESYGNPPESYSFEEGSITGEQYGGIIYKYIHDENMDELGISSYYTASVEEITDLYRSLWGWTPSAPSETNWFYESGGYYYGSKGDGDPLYEMEYLSSETDGPYTIVYGRFMEYGNAGTYDRGTYRMVFQTDESSRFGYHLVSLERQ